MTTTSSTSSAVVTLDNNPNKRRKKNAENLQFSSSMVRKPPSHILADGTFVHLPEPDKNERALFFERSIAQHRLVSATESSTAADKIESEKNEEKANEDTAAEAAATTITTTSTKVKKKDPQNKIHPIAIASARLHGKGIQELSKAINLGDMVGSGEYFALANIVNHNTVTLTTTGSGTGSTTATGSASKDDSNEGKSSDDPSKKDATAEDTSATSATASAAKDTNPSVSAIDSAAILEEQKLRASYLLKRKRIQFAQSARVLSRHEQRLSKAVVSQRIIDLRLLQLRQKWRLVAPEHGTRAIGPVRPTEVVAIDVEVYDRDRTGGGNNALQQKPSSQQPQYNTNQSNNNTTANTPRLGRIARMVPRYATIELRDGSIIDKSDWISKQKHRRDSTSSAHHTSKHHHHHHPKHSHREDDKGVSNWSNRHLSIDSTARLTRSEPFAVADPTLGKIDPDFDPDKVPILTLLMSIEKASTGYIQNCTLSSSTASTSTSIPSDENDTKIEENQQVDEKVITTLQHSLFCASLFESIRREITANNANTGNESSSSRGTSASQTHANNNAPSPSVWLSDGMEEVFLPPPSLMAGGKDNLYSTNGGLCVIHCHESEVKVQLDSEYSLTIQLVEAGTSMTKAVSNNSSASIHDGNKNNNQSGSQTPEQLQVLCRTLLLQAQFMYHDHSMKTRTQTLSSHKPAESNTGINSMMKPKTKDYVVSSPHILEQCVALGSKIIFERKVRSTLQVCMHVCIYIYNK